MKVLQVVHSFPPHNFAGTEIYTYNLSKELAKGHQVSVFHRICDLNQKEYQVEYKKYKELDTITINNTFRFCDSFEKFYKNEDIAKKFGEILDSIKPDIIHIQHLLFLSSTLICEAKKRKIPVVFTLHDYWLICPQWHFLKKDLSICNNHDISQCISCLDYQLSIKKTPKKIYRVFRNTMPNALVQLFKNIYLSYTKFTMDSAGAIEQIESRARHFKELCELVDRFIAPSEFIKNRCISFGIPEKNIVLLRSGIDNGLLSNIHRNGSKKIRFGFIGTILPAKGLDILIKAFNKINKENAELNIYGRLYPYHGFESYPGHIRRLVKNKNIRFKSEFPHDGIADILSEIDVLVVPSIWLENTPLVILEALDARIPVIASNIGGIPEIIKDNINGFLFAPGKVEELNNIINRVIQEPGIIKRFSNDNDKVKDIKILAQEIEELYISILNGTEKTCDNVIK